MKQLSSSPNVQYFANSKPSNSTYLKMNIYSFSRFLSKAVVDNILMALRDYSNLLETIHSGSCTCVFMCTIAWAFILLCKVFQKLEINPRTYDIKQDLYICMIISKINSLQNIVSIPLRPVFSILASLLYYNIMKSKSQAILKCWALQFIQLESASSENCELYFT